MASLPLLQHLIKVVCGPRSPKDPVSGHKVSMIYSNTNILLSFHDVVIFTTICSQFKKKKKASLTKEWLDETMKIIHLFY